MEQRAAGKHTADAATVIADLEYRARYWRSAGGGDVPVRDAAEDFALECERAVALLRAPRGTDAQILKERELTVAAIEGARAFGYQGVQPAPAGHWLMPFWQQGRDFAELLGALQDLLDDTTQPGEHWSAGSSVARARAAIAAAGGAR